MSRLPLAYEFDDVALVPQYSNIESRLSANVTTWLTKKTKVTCPLVPANMDTVICPELADIIIKQGGYPIFHRFCSQETQMDLVKKYSGKCYVSYGLAQDMSPLTELIKAGARGVCFDIAHGHNQRMLDRIMRFKKSHPDSEVIAGNVCTPEAVHDLFIAGADAVKVGIGPSKVCTTRVTTGQGVPQFTAIRRCAEMGKRLRIPIIADGGISKPKDMCLAIAAGASTCMAGGLFVRTLESASKKVSIRNSANKTDIFCKYRGQASKDFQDEYFGKIKEGTISEGTHFQVKCTGSAVNLINTYTAALKSSMTYSGAKDIKEFQRKAEFVQITGNYLGAKKR